jgi:hypothetical protein
VVKNKEVNLKNKDPKITIEEAKLKIAEAKLKIEELTKIINATDEASLQVLYKEVEKDLKEYFDLSKKKIIISFEVTEELEIDFTIPGGCSHLEYDWYSATNFKNKNEEKMMNSLNDGSNTLDSIKIIPEIKAFLSLINPIRKRIRNKIRNYIKKNGFFDISKEEFLRADQKAQNQWIDDAFFELLDLL